MSSTCGATRVAVGTVASEAFLPFVRVLVDSLRRFHPEVPFILVLAEPEATPPDSIDWCEAVPIDEIGLPPLEEVRTRYTLSEIVISAKAFLLRYLLDRGFERAVFLDCDILVLGDLSGLLRPACPAPIQLTPHVLDRIDGSVSQELLLLRSGVFNGGFVGVEESAEARRFLDWLQRRLVVHCRHDLATGLHNDQRWLDLVPALFPQTRIERDPGANVAYWNLHERSLTVANDAVLVNGGPGRFFHFSGYDPSKPEQPTRYRPQLARSDLGCAGVVFDRYADLLRTAGWRARPWRDAPGA
jgi:hypothetical protein